ncbi:MAG TPA: DUF115 domain-containing protein [Spirochaetota bacterium]|nr:DUF115 domain-containing protein [Spirochaetota bacterium]
MIKNIHYKIESAKDGNSSVIVHQNGKEIPLHSRINPLKESDATVYELDPGRFDLLLVLGCGLGYGIIKLKEVSEKFRQIVIIDILHGIETEIVKNPHTSFLQKGKNITILSGMETAELEGVLSGLIDFQELKGMQVIEHPQSLRIFPAYYGEVKTLIKKVIDKKAGDKATIKAFGNLFLRNALNNLGSFTQCLPVSLLEGRFRGRKAVIVSSAPSVEDNIDKLKFYEKDLYIIAVDSALPVLGCYGIKPDFVISIDPQARIGEHFLGHESRETLHVFSIVSPPELVEKYGGFISMNSHPVSQIIEDMYPGMNGSIDSATGSVAGDAFMFAFMAGFEFIAMTGFDFSFSQNIIYARETAYQKRYALYFNNRFKTAETFNAAYIFKSSRSLIVDGRYTRRSFIGYRNSFSSLINEKGFKNIFMINRRGLPLINVRSTDFDSFMKLTGTVNENKAEYLGGIKWNKKFFPADMKKVKSRLLDGRVFDEIIRESLGDDVPAEKRKKIAEMIEGIE